VVAEGDSTFFRIILNIVTISSARAHIAPTRNGAGWCVGN